MGIQYISSLDFYPTPKIVSPIPQCPWQSVESFSSHSRPIARAFHAGTPTGKSYRIERVVAIPKENNPKCTCTFLDIDHPSI